MEGMINCRCNLEPGRPSARPTPPYENTRPSPLTPFHVVSFFFPAPPPSMRIKVLPINHWKTFPLAVPPKWKTTIVPHSACSHHEQEVQKRQRVRTNSLASHTYPLGPYLSKHQPSDPGSGSDKRGMEAACCTTLSLAPLARFSLSHDAIPSHSTATHPCSRPHMS
jgi:hypothetical protein